MYLVLLHLFHVRLESVISDYFFQHLISICYITAKKCFIHNTKFINLVSYYGLVLQLCILNLKPWLSQNEIYIWCTISILRCKQDRIFLTSKRNAPTYIKIKFFYSSVWGPWCICCLGLKSLGCINNPSMACQWTWFAPGDSTPTISDCPFIGRP